MTGAPTDEPVEGVKITDKRRIDPETGAVREPAPANASAAEAGEDPTPPDSDHTPGDYAARGGAHADETDDEPVGAVSAESRVDELTHHLQRVTAEYANYRKRIERDRDAVSEFAVLAVLAELLPIFDDIERAREHGELTGAFKSVGDALQGIAAKLGLETFGAEGDLFDPEEHEALTHTEGEGLDAAIAAKIYQPGFKYKGRIVRPARVGVSE